MPEGPSIILAKEDIRYLAGNTVRKAVSSSTLTDTDELRGTQLKSVRSWGKHLLLKFNKITLRIHFLMFGSYSVGHPKAGRKAKLSITFNDGDSLHFYACSIRKIEGSLSGVYDWSADVMNRNWDPGKAIRKLKLQKESLICDALLDQNIFSGVGNIIKNEVLFRMRVHPLNKVGNIPSRQLKAIVDDAREYSFLFLKWKRAFVLKKHWEAHTKKKCPRDGHPIKKLYAGIRKRRSFFCDECQELFDHNP
ncbi:DNA-formamidopyrimidine glycosylase family protein [Chryseolinea sp. T2]|uniref:DNA-formamidopyrimidine glycosylase family protein n=1 Tax=Chryseolinea sp. T2 TaxID=3129255 RepID=UPI0030778BFD